MCKKILTALLTVCLILPFAFTFNACGGKNNKNDKKPSGTISANEWETIICEKNFTVSSANYSIRYDFDNGVYEIYAGAKDNDLLTVYLKKGYYKIENIGDKWWTKMQVASETEYNSNISGALNIVNYAKGNMSAFTLNGDKKYTASAAIDSLNSDISNLTSVLNISSFNAENLAVYKKTETVAGKNYSYVLLDLTGKTTDNTDVCITFSFDTAVSQFWLRKNFEQLTNFSIIGGPSTTDVDYSEIYFTNNGFRINYPNRTNKTQRDVYYERDVQTSDYFVYRQDESGIWSKSTITQIEYENVYNLTYGLYLGNILNNSSCLKYVKAAHSQNSKANYSENKAIAYENAQGTWWYYDVNFVFGGANFENASWKMKMTQGETSTAVYPMQLNTQNVTITFPQIAE